MTRRILGELYQNIPAGLPGNEDCGQMSAWYVMSAMGIYSVTPGLPEYQITSPLFEEVIIHLENGKEFIIKAIGNGKENLYIQDASLNGVKFSNPVLSHFDLINGGELTLQMGKAPSNWASDYRGSKEFDEAYIPVPYLSKPIRSFSIGDSIALRSINENDSILFTLNGLKPKLYNQPIALESNCNLKFWVVKDGKPSKSVKSVFSKKPGWKIVDLKHPFAPQYNAGGDQALVDGISGLGGFSSGDWQGFRSGAAALR